jgi:aminoglycoside phosphotransferase (APT) family kinase protein
MTVPASVLARWSRFAREDARVRAFGTGLINKTFLVEQGEEGSGERAVFQRLHPVFAGSVNEDIDVVTQHLSHKGLVTPRLLRTDDGAAFVEDPETQRPWRALSYVEGQSFDKVRDPAIAFQGGALVARFHAAVADLDYVYQHVRAGVHDTQKHLSSLASARENKRGHRLYAEVEPVAEAILHASASLPDFSRAPQRHCHGDLKISNLMFDPAGNAVCLVDLDTLGTMPLAHELGDMLRSWTNPAGEDVTEASVDLTIFRAAIEGYASGAHGSVTREERDTLVDGMRAICVELAARFCADALFESYFGWDERRYGSRGEHNLVRARGQLALARSVSAQDSELRAVVRAAFG